MYTGHPDFPVEAVLQPQVSAITLKWCVFKFEKIHSHDTQNAARDNVDV